MLQQSRARSTDKRFYGVVEAEVIKNAGDPEKEGRVQVKFSWFNGKMVTEWCRVAQIYAGNGYGSFFIPEEKDEVLVAFVHGDMRFPIIIGGLYNGKDKPSTSREDDKDQKLIRTKAGHEIIFDDTDSGKKISIIDSSTKNKIIIDTEKNTINIEADSDITVTSSTGKITFTAQAGIVLNSKADIKLDAATSIDATAPTINLN